MTLCREKLNSFVYGYTLTVNAMALTKDLLDKHGLQRNKHTTKSQQIIADHAGSAQTINPYESYTNKEYQMAQWKKLKMYTIWNVIRFGIIGILVFSWNIWNQKDINQHQPDCCRCYFAALHPEKYGLETERRIDWSYCMPQCVDCEYCETNFNGVSHVFYVHCAPCSELFVIVMYPLMYSPETSVFDTQTTCPAIDPKYTPTKRHTSRDWMKRSECPREISITTLHFFLKDYQNYGIWMLVLVTFYIALSITLVTCGKAYSSLQTGAPFFVWNVIVCINAVYTMFKPMQYYPKSLSGHEDTVCEIDAINEQLETAIEWCVWGSFAFILVGWILGFFRCWINRKVTDSGGRPDSVRRIHDIKTLLIDFEKAELLFAVLLAITFLTVMIVASVLMIEKRVDENRWEDDCMKIAVLITVDVLAVMAVIDIHFCEFCRNTRNYYFGCTTSGRSIEESNFRSHFGSINEPRPQSVRSQSSEVTLQTADEESCDQFEE